MSKKKKTLMQTFLTSLFGYSPVVWIFNRRGFNNKRNYLQETALKIT